MAIREGAWDCPQCGQTRIRGPEKHCPGCGFGRGEEVALYLPDDAREVTSPSEISQARSGPDWTCPYCSGDNRGSCEQCSNCGAARDGSKARPVVEHRNRPAPAPEPAPQGGCLGKLVVLVLVVVAIWGLLSYLGRPRQADAQVTRVEWSRVIPVEQQGTFTEEAWAEELPSGVRILSRKREVHHYDQVQVGSKRRTREVEKKVQDGTEKIKVGTKDMGNGYFEDVYETRPKYKTVRVKESYQDPIYEQRPRYRDKVRFEIDRWKEVRVERLEAADSNPRWPEVRLSGKQREGTRQESYRVIFTDPKGQTYTYKAPNQTEWSNFKVGDQRRIKTKGQDVVEILPPT